MPKNWMPRDAWEKEKYVDQLVGHYQLDKQADDFLSRGYMVKSFIARVNCSNEDLK